MSGLYSPYAFLGQDPVPTEIKFMNVRLHLSTELPLLYETMHHKGYVIILLIFPCFPQDWDVEELQNPSVVFLNRNSQEVHMC